MTDGDFDAETTTDDVLDGIDLSGRRILVTGASGGLGAETARALAAHGAPVVIVARDRTKAHAAAEAVRATAAPAATVEVVDLDLASLDSVRSCAADLLADGRPLAGIIANAGVMASPQGATVDGFETQFGTNHLGHFVLVNTLLPLLVAGAPARVVMLSSDGHRIADVDLEDPGFETTPYDPWVAYGRSKTANVLFAVGLDARWRDRGVRATAVHPGVIATDLGRHLTEESMAIFATHAKAGGRSERPMQFKSVPAGAATSVWAAAVADADVVGGRYCADCQVRPVAGPDRSGVQPYAVDPVRAEALWARSEQLVGQTFPAPAG